MITTSNFICGKCAIKQKMNLEERKKLIFTLQEGLNVCECGRTLEFRNNRLQVKEEGE